MNAVITAVFFCLIMALRSVGFSQDLPLAEYDTKAKVFSIGDIHGDLGALKKVLYSLGLYSTNNQAWVGGNSHLVFTGDLIDRGPDSKAVMDFIMELEVKVGF